jgi:hypothetical protein
MITQGIMIGFFGIVVILVGVLIVKFGSIILAIFRQGISDKDSDSE